QTGCVRSWGLFAECGSQSNTGTILRSSLQARPAWRSKLQCPNSLDRPRSMLCAAWLEAIGKRRSEFTIGSFLVAVNGPRRCARTVAAFTFMAATQRSPRTGQSSCGTRHLPSAIPDSEFGDPELGPLGMRHMLRNATFFRLFRKFRKSGFDTRS